MAIIKDQESTVT